VDETEIYQLMLIAYVYGIKLINNQVEANFMSKKYKIS
jgi:hypothetical protein